MVKKAQIIYLDQIKKAKLHEKEKVKKVLTDLRVCDEYLINTEVDNLRNKFGLNKKEEKK